MSSELDQCGFVNVREIAGVLCATQDYLTTRAIVVGINPRSLTYERRYCYQDRGEAVRAFDAYTDPTAHPPGMWIKVKGSFRGKPIDAFNPNWPALRSFDEVAPT
jgi:hypothetical protein